MHKYKAMYSVGNVFLWGGGEGAILHVCSIHNLQLEHLVSIKHTDSRPGEA